MIFRDYPIYLSKKSTPKWVDFSYLCCPPDGSHDFAQCFGQHQFAVQANKPGVEIQPTMYGIFFEDINFGADGGLYAEMVENQG